MGEYLKSLERIERMLAIRDNEAGVFDIMKFLLEHSKGGLEKAWDLPEVVKYVFEFPLPVGRADLVMFHIDGSISVVEFKNAGSNREILSGIGQLLMYAVQLGYSRVATTIRKILTAPVVGAGNSLLLETCEKAGVLFEPLGTLDEHRQVNAQVIQEYREKNNAETIQ